MKITYISPKFETMNKKLTLIAAILCCTGPILAQETTKGPELTFEETDFNFGFFDQDHAKLTHYFKFTNTGDENLIITNAYATCNCTVPEYPKYEIEPGQTDSIKVNYDGTTKRPGVFRKIVTLDYNAKKAENAFARVTITGEMTDKEVIQQFNELKSELDAEYKK